MNFWDISANVQIAVGIALIAILLMYIAFKVSSKSRKR